jgi:hypothetical protein
MPAQIQAIRLDVTNRFPMVAFRIRADGDPRQAEVAIGTDPSLFSSEGKKNRTAANFYSTHGNGGVRFAGREASFTLPPEVLARFIGNERLYFGLATAGADGAMKVAVSPTEASPYISIKGLSQHSMARVRVLPNRQQRAAGYGGNGQGQLEWAGDVAAPGMEQVANGAAPNGAIAANGEAPSLAVAPAPYDDGFGPMPDDKPAGARADAPVPAAQGLAYPPVRALAEQPVAVTPPSVSIPGTLARIAIETGISAAVGPIAALLTTLKTAANALGCSVGLGPQVGAGVGAGGQLGVGIIFGKDGDTGIYGAAEIDIGFITSISGTAVVTIVNGAIDEFSGWTSAFAIAGGEGVVGGAAVLLNDRGDFVGVSANVGIGVGFSPVDFYFAAQRGWATRVMALAQDAPAMARTRPPLRSRGRASGYASRPGATGLGARALDADPLTVDVKYRMFIPSPLIDAPMVVFGGDGRGFSYDGGTSRGEIHAKVRLKADVGVESLDVLSRKWGESIEYASRDTFHPDGKPDWWLEQRQDVFVARIDHATLAASDENLRIKEGTDVTERYAEATRERASLICIHASGSIPLSSSAPNIDAELTILFRIRNGVIEARVDGEHDGFPAHELYLNGVRVYGYDPVAEGAGPQSLFPPMDVDVDTPWTPIARLATTQELSAALGARAMNTESFTLNWDDVELIPQPTGKTCWAASGAMLVGWRDRVSLTPETIAEVCGRSTASGLSVNDNSKFAAEMGFVAEPPQSYSVDGFRTLLHNNGPLWVSEGTAPNLHAIVVTGMYSDAADTYVRIADPWDRVIGTPGAPGDYVRSHATGSRYIMRWEDFQRLYEAAITGNPPNRQILHNGGMHGHVLNVGEVSPPPGYAMSAHGADDAADGGIRLPAPPPPRARGMSGGAAAVAIGGFLLETVRDSAGDVNWELNQFRERKHPNDVAPANPAPYRDAPTIRLDQWPVSGGLVDDISAWFSIDWQYNGLSLGNVRISNIGTNDAVGWSLRVNAQIMDDNILYEPGGCAALRIRLHYHFDRSIGSEHIAITDVHLYGDGSHEIASQWVQAGVLSLGQSGRDDRRLPVRALDGGVSTVATVVGTAIGLVGGQAMSNPSWLVTRHPADVAPPGKREWQQQRLELRNVPWAMGPIDTMTANFTVTWEYDGLSLRNIFFYPSVDTAVLNEIEVSVHVIPREARRSNIYDPNSPMVAVVDLQFNYRFIHIKADDENAIHRATIYGDGGSWQNPEPEWINGGATSSLDAGPGRRWQPEWLPGQ